MPPIRTNKKAAPAAAAGPNNANPQRSSNKTSAKAPPPDPKDANHKLAWELYDDTSANDMPSLTWYDPNDHRKTVIVTKGNIVTCVNNSRRCLLWIGRVVKFSKWTTNQSKAKWHGHTRPLVKIQWLRQEVSSKTMEFYDPSSVTKDYMLVGGKLEGKEYSWEGAQSIKGTMNVEVFTKNGLPAEDKYLRYRVVDYLHDFSEEGLTVCLGKKRGLNKGKNGPKEEHTDGEEESEVEKKEEEDEKDDRLGSKSPEIQSLPPKPSSPYRPVVRVGAGHARHA